MLFSMISYLKDTAILENSLNMYKKKTKRESRKTKKFDQKV